MFRWTALVVLVSCLAISVHYRRTARAEGGTIPRRREGPLLVAGRVVVGLPLWGAVLTYVVIPRWMEWASFGLPRWARWLGVALGGLVVPAAWWVLSSLGSNVSETVLTKEDHRLVTRGPYRWIRHPLYTTGIGLLVSIGLMAANWFILSLSLVALLAARTVVVPKEEEALVARFGDEYRDYARRTGAMLPRLIPRTRN